MSAPSTNEETSGSSDANYVTMEEAANSTEGAVAQFGLETSDSDPSRTPANSPVNPDTAPSPYYKNLLLGIFSRVVPIAFLVWFFVYHYDSNQEGKVAYIGFAVLASYLCVLELSIMVAVYANVLHPLTSAETSGDNTDSGLLLRPMATDASSVQTMYQMELAACYRFFRLTPTVMTIVRELVPAVLCVLFRVMGYEYHNHKGAWAIYLNSALLVVPVLYNLVMQRIRPNPQEDARTRFIVLILRDFYASEFAAITSATTFSSNVVYEMLFYGDFLRLCLLNCGCMNGIS